MTRFLGGPTGRIQNALKVNQSGSIPEPNTATNITNDLPETPKNIAPSLRKREIHHLRAEMAGSEVRHERSNLGSGSFNTCSSTDSSFGPPPNPTLDEHRVIFRFLPTSHLSELREHTDVEFGACETIGGFKMELAKAGVCNNTDAKSGRYQLSITIRGQNHKELLMNGKDAEDYKRMMEAIEDMGRGILARELLLIYIQRWE